MSKLVVNLDRFWFDLGFGIPFGFRPPGPDRACCSWRYLKQPQATHGSEDAPVTTQDNPKMPLRPATRLPKRPSSKPRGGASLLVSLPPPTGPVRTVARFPSSHVFRPYSSLTLSFVRFAFLLSFFTSCWLALGQHLGSILGASLDPSWAKLGPRRLLEQSFLRNINVHETLHKLMTNQQHLVREATKTTQDRPNTAPSRS